MLRGGPAERWTGVALLSIALGLRAEGLPEPAPAEAPCTDLQSRVEQLIQRIHGMEGKLRDSAKARKAADQARMEAERRLAEGTQALGRLRAEVILLQDAKLALQARLERAEEQAESATQAFRAAEQTARRLTAERDAEAAERAALEDRVVELMELQQLSDEATRERRQDLTEGPSDPRRSLAERESDLKRIQSELRAVLAERDALNHRLDALRLAGPGPQGGATTLEETQDQAAAAARSLREALARVQGDRDPEARRALWDAAQELHRWQLRAARLSGARSVYRVGAGDSFALIADRFYGDDHRWLEIQEANRMVVLDPSHLIPGMTLVIP